MDLLCVLLIILCLMFWSSESRLEKKLIIAELKIVRLIVLLSNDYDHIEDKQKIKNIKYHLKDYKFTNKFLREKYQNTLNEKKDN